MDMTTMIQTVGFPITAVTALAWFGRDFITKVMEDSRQREIQLIENNNKLSDALRVVADATESATIQLNRLCDRMDTLEEKVSDLEKKFKK
jgi:polyhydroxyalkanoate synthesis regulator phasin